VQLSAIRACGQTLVVGALLAVMSACGGGGGGGGGSPNPVLGTLTFTTNENVALNGTLTATDPGGSAVTFTASGNPTSGTLAGLPGSGAFTYTPNANFTGSDSFGVTAADAAGNKSTGTVKITVSVDTAPAAGNAVVQSNDGKNVNILQSASDPEKDPLTLTITSGPNVGSATVNADGTVTVSGAKGLVTFGYTVTDPTGLHAAGSAAVFVGVAPFRAAFVADSGTNGAYEVFLTDFVSQPTQISTATQGTLRLKGFAIADNGSTVAYRTQDTNSASTTSLSFVRTATPATQVAIPIPNGLTPILDGNGKDQFVVSPDGTWIALIAGAGGSNSLYLVNTTTTTATAVVPSVGSSAAIFASQPTFTSDSKSVYFLASGQANGTNKSLFVVSTASLATPVMVSDLSRPFTSDEISAYSVAPNQSRIVFQGNRGGSLGIFYVDPAHLTQITQVNADITAAAITSSTVGLLPGLGGSNTGTKVAYDVGIPSVAPESVGIYVADVPPASPPAPQFVASIERVLGFSPDDSKLLYTSESLGSPPSSSSQVFEIGAGAGNSGTQLGNGDQGWYDSGGNIVLVANSLASGGAILSSNTRPFGSPSSLTATGTAAFDLDVSGVSQGVVIYGQAANTGTAPPAVTLQLFDVATSNAHPVTLKSSGASPVGLTTYVSKVVSK
jgi:Tol biopolymer transport system component